MKMLSWLNRKQNGFALVHLIIGIGIIILLAGVLYIWVGHTLQFSDLSNKRVSQFEDKENRVEKQNKQEQKEEEERTDETPGKSEESELQETKLSEKKEIEQEIEKGTEGVKPKEYQRKEITFLKFVSSENCLYFLDHSEIAELKSLNVNGIRICPGYSVLSDGSIVEEVPKVLIIQLIEKAHNAGFAVFLEVNFAGPPDSTEFGGFPHLTDPIFIEKIYKTALYWAEIAEKENVEFYSPLNEPNAVFANDNLVNQWIEKSQHLRPFFSGNLVLKLASTGPENIGNIDKYDYLSFDIMWGDAKYHELKDYLNIAINKASHLKEKYNLKGFFFGELGTERSMVTKVVQAEVFKTIFEETWDRVDGYCFLGWSDLEFRFRDNEDAKDIIKIWYKKRN